MKKKFCVSLTTIPPRFNTLEKTLDSIFNQNLKPNKIFLNIPKTYKRFDNNNLNLDYLEKRYKALKISHCDDFGPGTKLLGSLSLIDDYDYVVLIDDDHIYDREMLKIFNESFYQNPNKAYSFCVYDILDCKIGQGADGFLINSSFLKKINSFYHKYVENNSKLFFNDDLWISIFINKFLNKDIENLFSKLSKHFLFFKKKSVYKKHIKVSSLIEKYNIDGRTAKSLKFKENCEEYLNLKFITNNFKEF